MDPTHVRIERIALTHIILPTIVSCLGAVVFVDMPIWTRAVLISIICFTSCVGLALFAILCPEIDLRRAVGPNAPTVRPPPHGGERPPAYDAERPPAYNADRPRAHAAERLGDDRANLLAGNPEVLTFREYKTMELIPEVLVPKLGFSKALPNCTLNYWVYTLGNYIMVDLSLVENLEVHERITLEISERISQFTSEANLRAGLRLTSFDAPFRDYCNSGVQYRGTMPVSSNVGRAVELAFWCLIDGRLQIYSTSLEVGGGVGNCIIQWFRRPAEPSQVNLGRSGRLLI